MGTTLVVSYSRTGTTSRIAREVAGALGADLDPIEEVADRRGVMGFALSVLESIAKGLPTIRTQKDPSRYDLVVLGTPVWAGSMASPVRAYLAAHLTRLPRVAFFATMRGSGADAALRELRFMCGADAALSCSFTEHDVENLYYGEKLNDFVRRLKRQELRVNTPPNPAAKESTWIGDIEPAGRLIGQASGQTGAWRRTTTGS